MANEADIPLTISPDGEHLEDALAMCVSGGGYRAMLFHLGSFWYLVYAGLLKDAARISSVSGGSITSGLLGLRWNALQLGSGGDEDRFRTLIVAPVRKMASTTIDVGSVLGGIVGRGSASDRIMKWYDEVLYDGATLQDLPDAPRFVINATNVQSGALFRFSKPYARDYRVGEIAQPRLPLSMAVGASSAFPPVLSPVRLKLEEQDWVAGTGADLQFPPYTTDVRLTDGGVYDNMGLETVWKRYRTILVSDAGGKLQAEPSPRADPVRHLLRINGLIDNQVRSLRARQVVSSYENKLRKGAYWGMWTDPAKYSVTTNLSLPSDKARELAEVGTRLAAMPDDLQERLINFGFGMAERAVRTYWKADARPANAFVYPRGI